LLHTQLVARGRAGPRGGRAYAQGQKDVKELHWHAQIPGMVLTTSADGFNAWKAFNVP